MATPEFPLVSERTASEPRLGTFHWVVLFLDILVVTPVAVNSSAWRTNMLPTTLGVPLVIVALAWILVRRARWPFVVGSCVAVLSLPLWYVFAPDLGPIIALASRPIGIVMAVANLFTLCELAGWKSSAVLLLAIAGLTVFASRFPVGYGKVSGRTQVTEDPKSVVWSRNSRLLLYVGARERYDIGSDNRLYTLNLTTGYRRSYELPVTSELDGPEPSPDSMSVAFVSGSYSHKTGEKYVLYALDLRSAKIRSIYSADRSLYLRGWKRQDRLLFSVHQVYDKPGVLYAIDPDAKHGAVRIGQCGAIPPTYRTTPDFARSPDGHYYYRVEHRGGGDWYNYEPDPLWLGKLARPQS